MYDRVELIEQGKVVPNERLATILEFAKEQQDDRSYKRSGRCPSKRHLEMPNHQLISP